MNKTKVSYKITAFADERKVYECEVNTTTGLCLKVVSLKYRYENDGNFDSIRIITYVNDEPVSEEWNHM